MPSLSGIARGIARYFNPFGGDEKNEATNPYLRTPPFTPTSSGGWEDQTDWAAPQSLPSPGPARPPDSGQFVPSRTVSKLEQLAGNIPEFKQPSVKRTLLANLVGRFVPELGEHIYAGDYPQRMRSWQKQLEANKLLGQAEDREQRRQETAAYHRMLDEDRDARREQARLNAEALDARAAEARYARNISGMDRFDPQQVFDLPDVKSPTTTLPIPSAVHGMPTGAAEPPDPSSISGIKLSELPTIKVPGQTLPGSGISAVEQARDLPRSRVIDVPKSLGGGKEVYALKSLAEVAADVERAKNPDDWQQKESTDAQGRVHEWWVNKKTRESTKPVLKGTLGKPQVSEAAKAKADATEEAMEAAAQSLARGELSRLREIASLRGDQRLRIFARTRELNPSFNTAEIDRKIKMEDSRYSGTPGTVGANLQSFGVFLQHAGDASKAVNSIRLTDAAILNKPLNWLRRNVTGSEDIQSFMTALEPVRKEFESFLLGGRALYADDRRQAEIVLSENSSPAQIQAALKRMGHVAKARLSEINWRYKGVMGRDLQDALSPEAIAGAKQIGVDVPKELAGGSTAPGATGTSDASGVATVQVVGPNGETRTGPAANVEAFLKRHPDWRRK